MLQPGQPRDFALWIDSTIESASFSVVVQCKDSMVIWRPSGEAILSSGAAGFASTETASARLLTVSRPETGPWRIRMSGSGEASVSVQAKTELDLGGFEFVRVGGRPGHEGLFRIQGQPTSPDQIARARIDGAFRSASFLFVSDIGERLHGMELRREGDEFTGNVRLPTGPFRVMVEGYDERGLPYQRVLSRLYHLQTIEVASVTHVEELRAGTTTKMAFQIRNGGPPGTLQVMVVWVGRNFVKTARPMRLSLASGEAARIEADVDIPADAAPHTEVSVTVTASRVTPPASENGIALQLTIR